MDQLNEDEYIDATETAYELIDEYVTEMILYMSKEDFYEQVIEAVTEELVEMWDMESNADDLYEFVDGLIEEYFEFGFITPRSYTSASIIEYETAPLDKMNKKINDLQQLDQPQQRSKEWYEFRHNVMTASGIGKCLGSEAQKNSIIYEKCKPVELKTDAVNT